MLFGDLFEDDNRIPSTIKTYLATLNPSLITNDIIAFAPWIRHIYHTENYKVIKKGFGIRNDLMVEIYEDRKQNLDPNNLKGVIDNIILLCQDKEYLRKAGMGYKLIFEIVNECASEIP